MLEPGGRGDPLAPFKGIVIRVLGILVALVLFLSIMTVPLKGFDTDLNNASMSSGKAVSLDKVRASLPTEEVITPMSPTQCAGTRWSKVNFLSPDPGRHSDGGGAEQVPPENQILSGDMVDSRRYIKCTVLQRLYYHRRTCPWFRNVDNPLEGDEAAISKSHWEGTKRLHNQICERLQNVPTDVVTYYLEVRANMTDLCKHARYIQNVTREGTTQPPRGQSADATEAPPIVMAQIVPVWQMRLASLNTLATPLKQTLADLQVDLSALKYKLNSARKGAVLPGPEVVESLSGPRWAAGWTDMSKPENKPVSAHTRAIALINKWFAETSALDYVVSEVYFELEDLDMTIRDVVRKRLTSDGPYPWSSAESFEGLDNAKRDIVRKGLISADSLELKLFLTRISQEIRRLYNSAQSSKSMQGWGDAEGSKGADGSGKSDVGDDSELEWRTAPLV